MRRTEGGLMKTVAGRYVCGLDVGTTKVCAVVAREDVAGEIAIVGIGVVPSEGLQRGIVVDRELATGAIRRSVLAAEESSGTTIARAWVGLTGGHISSTNVRGRAYLTGPQVTQADVDHAIQSAREAVATTSDRRIIQHVVRDFVLDGEKGIRRPLGMVGRQLDVNLHVVTGRASTVDNLTACVEAAGVQVAAHVLEPPATARAVLTQPEISLGCVLVDIGGGTTDIAVFSNGSICHTSAFPLGGNQVTMDIAKLLRVSPDDAEELKKRYGHALAEQVSDDEEIEITLVGGENKERVPRKLLAEIIQARMEEIVEAVGRRLTEEGLWALAPAGVVLSGGGAELPGAAPLTSAVLGGVPTRIGSPRPLRGRFRLVDHPMYATGVGLALMAAEAHDWCTRRVTASRDGASRALSFLRGMWSRVLVAWHRWQASRAR
jgi:cell division protein FtsA